MKTLVIVPAFNEEGSITTVIKDLQRHGYRDIVVVDDGSSDSTAKIAKSKNIFVVSHIINRGLGASLGTGFEFAKQNGFETVVTFDADGQHKAKDIPKVIKHIKNGRADVVVGSRLLYKKKEMPLDRLILNHLSNLATLFLYGVRATDTLSGLRAFNKKSLESIRIKTQRMEVSNEFFKEIRRNKLRYREVPLEPIYTQYSLEGSDQGHLPVIRLAATMILRLFR